MEGARVEKRIGAHNTPVQNSIQTGRKVARETEGLKEKEVDTETERGRLHFAMQILPAKEVESRCCFHTETEV